MSLTTGRKSTGIHEICWSCAGEASPGVAPVSTNTGDEPGFFTRRLLALRRWRQTREELKSCRFAAALTKQHWANRRYNTRTRTGERYGRQHQGEGLGEVLAQYSGRSSNALGVVLVRYLWTRPETSWVVRHRGQRWMKTSTELERHCKYLTSARVAKRAGSEPTPGPEVEKHPGRHQESTGTSTKRRT
jgi:hypothetical protein